MGILKNALAKSHEIVESVVEKGNTVIDATAGNGNDTLFLSRLVGNSGKVFSFDIQEKALLNTESKLKRAGLLNQVELIKDGHQNMDLHVKGQVKAVMFNLGYLPGGDHSISTTSHTTITAIKKSMKLLAVGGVISIVIYHGGDTGFEEKEAVIEFVKGIDYKQFTVMKLEFVNQINCPPILVCIEKLYL